MEDDYFCSEWWSKTLAIVSTAAAEAARLSPDRAAEIAELCRTFERLPAPKSIAEVYLRNTRLSGLQSRLRQIVHDSIDQRMRNQNEVYSEAPVSREM